MSFTVLLVVWAIISVQLGESREIWCSSIKALVLPVAFLSIEGAG